MIAALTSWFILFGWVSFLGFSVCIITYLDECNYWMPPIYAVWGIILFVVTIIVVVIS